MENKKQEMESLLGEHLTMKGRIIAFIAVLFVYFFYCYNFMVGIFVRPTFVNEFGFSLAQASSIFAVMSFGTIPGTIIAGMCSTKFGKKRTLIGIVIAFSLLTGLPLVNPTNVMLWRTARLLTGMALGGVYGTAIPLVSEIFPQKYRGKLAALCTTAFSLAMIFAGQLYAALGDANWQLLVLTAVVPPLLGIIPILFLVPDDSERMRKMREEAQESNEKISYIGMYKGKYLWIGIGTILLSGLNFISYSGFNNNATTYLTTSLSMSAATAGTIFSIQGLGQMIGYNLWGVVSDKFGRKYPVIGMILVSLLVLVFSNLGPESVNMFKGLALLMGIGFGFSGAWGAYYTELFPAKYRAMAAGMSFNGGRIISTFGLPMLASVSATSFGIKGVFTGSAIISVLGALIWLMLPETLEKK